MDCTCALTRLLRKHKENVSTNGSLYQSIFKTKTRTFCDVAVSLFGKCVICRICKNGEEKSCNITSLNLH